VLQAKMGANADFAVNPYSKHLYKQRKVLETVFST